MSGTMGTIIAILLTGFLMQQGVVIPGGKTVVGSQSPNRPSGAPAVQELGFVVNGVCVRYSSDIVMNGQGVGTAVNAARCILPTSQATFWNGLLGYGQSLAHRPGEHGYQHNPALQQPLSEQRLHGRHAGYAASGLEQQPEPDRVRDWRQRRQQLRVAHVELG
jgi:hypothetical protein